MVAGAERGKGQIVAGLLSFLSLAGLIVGTVALVKGGIERLGIPSRRRGAAVVAASFVTLLVAGAISPRPEPAGETMRPGAATSPSPGPKTSPPSPTPSPSPIPTLSPSPTPSPTPSQTGSQKSAQAAAPAVTATSAQVTRIIDGDTAEMVLASGRTERVRFIGVDTPERGQPLSADATTYTSDRIAGKQVFLQTDVDSQDQYGRLLAYVWFSEPKRGDEAEAREYMLNGRMLIDGFAVFLTVPPNVKYVNLFTRFQEEARSAGRGVWGLPQPTPSPAKTSGRNCDPSYPDICIPPPPPDLDCHEIEHRNFRVLPPDLHGFDRDKDGIGCET